MITNYQPLDYDILIGIDVDKTSFAFTTMDHYNMKRSKKIPAEPDQLYNYIENHFEGKSVLCAYEAGPTGFHLYDELKKKGQPCLVVAPTSIPKAPNQKVKNNRIDSEKLSRYLKSGELKSIRVPESDYRELRQLVKSRELYARHQRSAKQRIKALLLSVHLYPEIQDVEQNWSNNYVQRLKTLSCSEAVRHRLDMLLMDLTYARQQLVSSQKVLKKFCEDHSQIKTNMAYLRSIDGIGFITAANLLGKIGDPCYLTNVRELAGFAGLVPREHSTGNAIRMGSITHLGDPALRSLLIEAAWIAVRKNTSLQQFYHRVKQKHHPKIAAQKAIVAVARKLTCIIYAVLKEQKMFVRK
jgi:transposase